MGIFGLIGLVLLVVAFCLLFRATLRREGPRGFAAGAAIAGLAYQVPLLLSGNVGLRPGRELHGDLRSHARTRGRSRAPRRYRAGRCAFLAAWLGGGNRPSRGRGDSPDLRLCSREISALRQVDRLARGAWSSTGLPFRRSQRRASPARIPATTLLASHQREVRDALAAIHSGAPPLLGMTSGGYYPVDGAGHGISLYLPLIGQLFHQSNPNVLMAWFFLGAFALSLAIYPLVFAELFGSRLVALVAPLLLAWRLAFIHYSDTYWVYAWSIATALPLLLLVKRRWGGRRAPCCSLGRWSLRASRTRCARTREFRSCSLGLWC